MERTEQHKENVAWLLSNMDKWPYVTWLRCEHPGDGDHQRWNQVHWLCARVDWNTEIYLSGTLLGQEHCINHSDHNLGWPKHIPKGVDLMALTRDFIEGGGW